MKKLIYADNAATTSLSTAAFEAMIPWLTDEYANASQPYSFARKPKKALADAREAIAACIGADASEIYFTSGGTESDNWAIKGTMLTYDRNRSCITTAIEHHAVLHACESIERLGYPVAYIPAEPDGCIDTDFLYNMISNDTKLVSVMFANNEIGTVQRIAPLCNIAHSENALFHTDAVQAVGHVPINVRDLGVDMLSASAHKFHGPKGVGFLYVRNGVELAPYADGGGQEFGRRAGTENVAAIVGMAVALEEACEHMQQNAAHADYLASIVLSILHDADIQYRRNGRGIMLPGLLSLTFPGASGEALLHRLDLMGICVSTGSACNSVKTEISHVLQSMRLDEEIARGTIRISLGDKNTEEEAVAIGKALVKILKK